MEEILKLVKVSKYIGGREVLKNVTFVMRRGDRVNIYGPRNSGKSILLKCILDLIVRDGGTIEVFGLDPLNNRSKILRYIGYIPQNIEIQGEAEMPTMLDLIHSLYGEDLMLLEELGLLGIMEKKRNEPYIGLRLYVYQAIVKDSEIILVDDIGSKMDGKSIYILKRYMDRKNASVITTSREPSNILGETRFYYIEDGRLFESPVM